MNWGDLQQERNPKEKYFVANIGAYWLVCMAAVDLLVVILWEV